MLGIGDTGMNETALKGYIPVDSQTALKNQDKPVS